MICVYIEQKNNCAFTFRFLDRSFLTKSKAIPSSVWNKELHLYSSREDGEMEPSDDSERLFCAGEYGENISAPESGEVDNICSSMNAMKADKN